MNSTVTIRHVAKRAKMSIATVSRALQNKPRVPKEIRHKIQSLAKQMGYVPRPFFSAMASGCRGAKKVDFPSLAYLCHCPDRRKKISDEYYHCGKETAKTLGYQLEEFSITQTQNLPTILRILYNRRVFGILLGDWFAKPIPVHYEMWKHFAIVGVSGCYHETSLHCVKTDFTRDGSMAMAKAWKQGYRRIGAAVFSHSPRLPDDNQRLGGILSMHHDLADQLPSVPPLMCHHSDMESVTKWFKKHKPDCVIAFNKACYFHLLAMGIKIPEEVGFIALIRNPPGIEADDISGLCFDAQKQVTAGIHLLDQCVRAEKFAFPQYPVHISIPSLWCDGSTLPSKL